MSALNKLFSRMKNDEGGYMMITVIVILDIVLAAFVMATFAIIERNYTGQVKHFSELQTFYEERGEVEAVKGRLKSVISKLNEADVSYDENTFTIGVPSAFSDVEFSTEAGTILSSTIKIPSDSSGTGSLEVTLTANRDNDVKVSTVIRIDCEVKDGTPQASIELVQPPEVVTS